MGWPACMTGLSCASPASHHPLALKLLLQRIALQNLGELRQQAQGVVG
jgi:hypothetical protein